MVFSSVSSVRTYVLALFFANKPTGWVDGLWGGGGGGGGGTYVKRLGGGGGTIL